MNLVTSRGADIAFFLQSLDGGGAERAIVALAAEIAKRGHAVDLVVGDADTEFRSEVSTAVRLENFATKSALLGLFRLVAYLRRRNPAVVMSALDLGNIILTAATKLTGYKGRTVISQRAVVAAAHPEWSLGRRLLITFLQRVLFLRVDALISNSHAAANELQELLGVPVVIPNAVDTDRINRLAGEPLNDHRFSENRCPLILSVGSLTTRKDMGTLIKAFAIVKAQREVRLAIVGEGYQPAERRRIEGLISELGLGESIYLPGFDANPYKWMAAAAVFVSSSTAEGFPNVIAETLALGRPIVATDCPGDTAELLGHGKWGRLVPVGDPQRMAGAILAALDDPGPPDGRVRAADFAPSRITSAYLNVLLPRFEHAADAFRESV